MKVKSRIVLILLISGIVGVLVEATLPATINNDVIPNLDKVTHFTIFGLLAYLAVYLLHSEGITLRWYLMVGVIFLIGTLGFIAEWVQAYTPGRQSGLADLCADIAGACVFITVWKIWLIRQNRT